MLKGIYKVRTWFQALEKAKDAGRKERVLVRQREQVTTPENINLDLTYSVSIKYLLSKIILARICRFWKFFSIFLFSIVVFFFNFYEDFILFYFILNSVSYYKSYWTLGTQNSINRHLYEVHEALFVLCRDFFLFN